MPEREHVASERRWSGEAIHWGTERARQPARERRGRNGEAKKKASYINGVLTNQGMEGVYTVH